MKRILKYKDHQKSILIAEELIELILNPQLNESKLDDSHIKKILKSLAGDLKFNYSLIFTFGAGIGAMIPIVSNLLKNASLNVELTDENIVLLCITALAITYLEEQKNKTGEHEIECQDCKGQGHNIDCELCDGEGCDDCEKDCETCKGSGLVKSLVTKEDAKTLLEELKLRGIGNGIVKKLVNCFKSIGNVLKVIFRNTPYIVTGFLDMFGYTSLLLPTMNAISTLIGKYDFNLDNLPINLLTVGVGVTSLLAKNSLNYLITRLKDKFNLKVNPDLDKPTVVRPYSGEIKDGEERDLGKNQLIKEQ